MDKLNVSVLSNDIDLRIEVKNKLSSENIIIGGYGEINEAGILKLEGLLPDVVICAQKGEIEDSVFEFIQRFLTNVRSCAAVLMADNIDVELVNKAALYGIRKVLPLDIDAKEFEDTLHTVYSLELERQLDTNASKKVRSRAISFFSGKGGTGKTTVATNVACALAKAGKKVILVDFDLQFGDVAISLDLEPKDTVVELVQDRGGINIENVNSFALTHSTTGLTVLCGPKSPEYAEYISAADIEKIISVLRPYFEYIILDLPPAFNDTSIAALENSDDIYLVYNMEILSLQNAKVSINILDSIQQKDKLNIIINKYSKGLIRQKDFEKMFEMPIFATVSFDLKAANVSVNKGQPFILSYPRANVSREMLAISDKIIFNNTGILPISSNEKKKKFSFKAKNKPAKA